MNDIGLAERKSDAHQKISPLTKWLAKCHPLCPQARLQMSLEISSIAARLPHRFEPSLRIIHRALRSAGRLQPAGARFCARPSTSRGGVHPDHQRGVDRGSASVRVIRCELLVHPSKVENAVNLADQMIAWHYLVEIEGIKNWPCPPSRRPIMSGSRRCPSQSNAIIVRESSQWEFRNTIKSRADMKRQTVMSTNQMSPAAI